MKKRDTRHQLIEAGAQAMLEKSYNGVGLKEILDRVGVPKGSFYNYFPSKEQFAVEVIEYYGQKAANLFRSILLNRNQKPKERLLCFFEKARDHHLKSERYCCLVAKLAMEVANLSSLMQSALKYTMDQWLAIFAQCIREGQILGEIKGDVDAYLFAEFLFGSWEGALLQMQVQQNLDMIDHFIDFVFTQILN